MDLLKSHRMSCLVAQIHELRNLHGGDRAKEVGCAFYSQEESRDILQSYAHHLQVQWPRVARKIIIIMVADYYIIMRPYLGIMGSRKTEKSITAMSCIREFFGSHK